MPTALGAWQGRGVSVVDPLTGQGRWFIEGGIVADTRALGLRYGDSGPLWFYAGLAPTLDESRLSPLLLTQLTAPQSLTTGLITATQDPATMPLTETVSALISTTRLDL